MPAAVAATGINVLGFCALLYDEIMAVNVKSLNRDQTSSLYAF